MTQITISQQYKLLIKTVHTFAACIWVGGGFAVLVLLDINNQSTNGDEIYAFNHAITSIDDFLIRPAAAFSLASGTLLCLTSRWGITKYRWIILKWIVTVSAMLFGIFYIDPWMKELALSSDLFREQTLQNDTYHRIFHAGVLAGYLQTATLLTLVLVSIFKPSLGTPNTKSTSSWHNSVGLPKLIRSTHRKKAGI